MTAYMDHKDLANESIDEARAREISDNARRVLDAIAECEYTYGRDAGSVTLLAATKTRDVGEIMAAIDAGVHMIGENRPQEVVAKIDGLRYLCERRGFVLGAHNLDSSLDHDDSDALDPVDSKVIPFHLIGQLQSNKIGKMLPLVDTIESVDSLELATKIARRAAMRDMSVRIFLEVNASGEETKSGCTPDEALDVAAQIGSLEGLELAGLMTIGAHVDEARRVHECFACLRELRDRILSSGAAGTQYCRELSMGMTRDMAIAIEEGATIVRVGSGIFGERAFV